MAGISFRKNILPHLIAILVFIISTIIFYSPIYFDNQEISQHDILQGIGGGQEIVEYRERTGEEALWTNSMFSGMPAYLINTYWSGDMLNHVQEFLFFNLPYSARHSFLLMVTFYVLLLTFGVRPYLAIGGALAFGFTSYNIIGIYAGHIWRIVAVAYMPLTLAGIHLVFRNKRKLGFALTAIALGLQLRPNHVQISYYLLLMILLYGFIQLIYHWKDKKVKAFFINCAIVFFAGILAIGANFGRLWSTYEYSKYSMRGAAELSIESNDNESGLDKEYAFRFSNSIFEPMVLLVPNFMGGPNYQSLDSDSNLGEALKRNTQMNDRQVKQQLQYVPTYWGKQPVTAPYYAGAIMAFLFILGMFHVDRRTRTWLITAAVIGIVLSWGHNFKTLNYLIFDYVPGYNKFRSVTFTIIITIIAIHLMGMIGLNKWISNLPDKNKKRSLMYALGITVSFLLLLVLVSGIAAFRGPVDENLSSNVPQWFIEALRKDRAFLLRADALRSLLFVSLSGILLWLVLKGKINRKLVAALIALLIYIDVATVASRTVNKEAYSNNPTSEYFSKTEADEYILSDTTQTRVFNLNNPFNEARTSYYHQSIGGYHGAKIRRYQDFIDHCISVDYTTLVNRLRSGSRDLSEMHTLNMLNVKYIMAGESREHVIVNNQVLGNAWIVNQIQIVNSADKEIAATCKLNPAEVAVVDTSKFTVPATSFNAEGSVELSSYDPNYLVYNANLSDTAFIVFSEIYYPVGWKALIDGQEVEYIRANYILRALVAPPGNHRIEFVFSPDSYLVGNQVMLASSLLILLTFLGAVFYEIRNRLNRE